MLHVLEQLDRRHNGYSRFKYRVTIGGEDQFYRTENLNEIRDWCWQIWGSSSELENAWPELFKDQRTVVWCWRYELSERRGYIYLKNDEQASFFKLKWL